MERITRPLSLAPPGGERAGVRGFEHSHVASDLPRIKRVSPLRAIGKPKVKPW
jgi:hypothetical protein